MRNIAQRIVSTLAFEYAIIALIIGNAVLLGMGTSPTLTAKYGYWFELGHQITIGIFILEALLKMAAEAPRIDRYFKDGWNVFDFLIIVFSLIPATGQFAVVARLARLMRVLRLISTIQELRLMVTTLVRSIPSIGHIMLLMSLIVYIYAIIGHQLFHEHDPTYWRNLGVSVLTMFRLLTLEGWTDIMDTAMEVYPLAWIYFASFVVTGTFVVINLFIAVVINNLDEAKMEQLRELERPASRDEILRELRSTRRTLRRLEDRVEKSGLLLPDDSDEPPPAAER